MTGRNRPARGFCITEEMMITLMRGQPTGKVFPWAGFYGRAPMLLRVLASHTHPHSFFQAPVYGLLFPPSASIKAR